MRCLEWVMLVEVVQFLKSETVLVTVPGCNTTGGRACQLSGASSWIAHNPTHSQLARPVCCCLHASAHGQHHSRRQCRCCWMNTSCLTLPCHHSHSPKRWHSTRSQHTPQLPESSASPRRVDAGELYRHGLQCFAPTDRRGTCIQ